MRKRLAVGGPQRAVGDTASRCRNGRVRIKSVRHVFLGYQGRRPASGRRQSGQLISNMIAMHMTDTLNWSMAAALAALLLGAVLLLYWVYDRMVGIDNLKLG